MVTSPAAAGAVVSVAQPADDAAEPMEELAMTGVESGSAGLTMLGLGIMINTSRRRSAPVPGRSPRPALSDLSTAAQRVPVPPRCVFGGHLRS